MVSIGMCFEHIYLGAGRQFILFDLVYVSVMAVTGVILYIFAKYSSDFCMDFRYCFFMCKLQ